MRVSGIPYVQGRNSYKDSDSRKYGIAIHNTSNNATDSDEASYATRRTDGVSAHFYVDADSVTQSLDTDAVAGHAGSYEGNQNAIAVEITGTNDKSRAWWLSNVAWDQLGRVLAQVIRHHWPDGSFKVRRASIADMEANPKVKALYGHNDMRQAWGGTTHTDPGPNFPWDRLISAVNAALTEGEDMTQEESAKLHATYTAVFLGGSSCGATVPEEYRVDPDSRGNALVDKLNYLTAKVGTVAPTITVTREELVAAVREVLAEGVVQ